MDDYAIFVGLRQQYKGKFWNKWPKLIRERNKLALRKIIEDCRYLHEEIKFQQYIFYRQWNQLKEY
ncbi:MAG: 4-alpha-glucanotransferase, partial [Candidatus Omnitrophica bacterium]|nr:4-alpha-glucanotransferase [Candidatus Omnitrophota bacterium]